MADDLADVLRRPLLLELAMATCPSVVCFIATGRIDEAGTVEAPTVLEVRLSPDDAGNLVHGPVKSVELIGRRHHLGGWVSSTWRVTVVALIEAEAGAGYESVAAGWLGRLGDG